MRIFHFFVKLWFDMLMKLFVKLGGIWFREVHFTTDDEDRVKHITFYAPKWGEEGDEE